MKVIFILHIFGLFDHLQLTTSQDGILTGWDFKDGKEADTKKDLVQPDEKHLEGIPKFLQQPQSVYYVSKNKPAVITCIAQPVSHANIICADKQYSYMNEDISPSGLRVLKMDYSGRPSKKGQRWKFSLEVKQKEVIEWFSEYRCYCEAWNQIELLQRVKKVDSTSAIVYESYFNKDFKSPPKSQEIVPGETLKLTCVAPDAKPSAEIHWLKNGQNLTIRSHSRIEVNIYGQLLIRNVRLLDSGNYSCVATSQGIEKLSSAIVTVLEIGQWSDWMEWSGICPTECSKKMSCPSECSSTTRQKFRFCKKLKDRKTHCIGERLESERCSVHCDSNIWTYWTEWSKCSGSLCRKMRTRQCNTNNCNELNSKEIVNCTFEECGGSVASFIVNNEKNAESNSVFINTHDIAMYIGLFVAVSVFLMIVVVIFCLIRRRVLGFSPNRVWRYTTTSNGIPMFYSDKNLKKNFSTISDKEINLIDINQPSLYRSMVLPNSLQFLSTNHSDMSSNSGYTDVGNDLSYIQCKQLPSLPLIATPLLSNIHQLSLIRPSYSDSKVSGLHQQIGLPRHISTLGIPDSRPTSDHYQELGNTDNETTEPSINEPWLPESFDGENMVWSTLDSDGGRISLPHTDITLTCPPKALAAVNPEQIFLAACSTEQDIPKLKEHETLLSSIIVCGPANIIRLKPFILTLPHCAYNVDSKEWSLIILTSYSPLKQKPYWQKFLDLDHDDSALPPGHAQVMKDKLYLMTNQLQRFCLIGSSHKNKDATKIFRIAAYCTSLERRHSDEELIIKLYLLPDISDSLNRIHDFETNRLGSKLITNQKQFLCEDGAGNIVLTVAELSSDWKICIAKNYQEIPFQDLWHSSNLNCSFTFVKKVLKSHSPESKISLNSLDSNWFCSIYLHQPNSRHNKQHIILSSPTSSPHTSLSATSTQFSSYSVGGGSQNCPYFVDDCNRNIVEPPFKLPENIKTKLSKLLDPPSPYDNDWRQLARFLSINRSLQFFSSKPSPTEIIFDLWEAQNSTQKSIIYLVDIFRKIGRMDCVAILEKDFLQNNC